MRDGDRLAKELKPNIPRDVHASVLKRFLILEPVGFFEPFASFNVGADFSQILSAFESNLRAAVNVGSMPFTFVQHAQHDLMFSRIFAAECIRHLDDTGGDLTARQREAARAVALEKIAVVDRQRELIENIVHELHQFLVDRSLGFLADELLRQTAVMIWGALEVLATDLTRHVLNRMPKLASHVLAGDPFKRHFSPRGIPIEVLASYDFNVSTMMGEVICDAKRADDPSSMHAIFQVIGGGVELLQNLKSETLWMLFQRRNLIVHRRGMVDMLYLSKTGDTKNSLNAHLVVSGAELDDYLILARDIGLMMVRAADHATQGSRDERP